MAANWLNSVDIDFGVQFPRLSMRTVHGFVRSLKVEAQDLLGLVAVQDTRNQVARITFTTEACNSSFLSRHSGIVKTELEGKEVNVVIRDSNIQEKFVRIAGVPQNLDLGVVKTRLKEYGTIIDARWERYRVVGDEVLYPVLATWMIVRMTVTKNIPSYLTIGSYRAVVKYEGQKPTCRLCDDESHFSYSCPTLRRNKEPFVLPKPVPQVPEKNETISKNPLTTPMTVDPEVSKVLLECGLQDSLPGGTLSLETQAMECEVPSPQLTTTSIDIPPGQIPLSRTTIPETQDSGPSSINMESAEPEEGEVGTMEIDNTKETLKTPTERRSKRFKPTLTSQNSKQTSSVSTALLHKKLHK